MSIFSKVAMKKPRYNKFDLSHERKLSVRMGDLIPCLVQDIVPGDKFRVNTEIMMRFAPMLAPIMHRVNVFVHYFFVPNRLVWDEWEDFITGGPDGDLAPIAPFFNYGNTGSTFSQLGIGSLADYLGIPALTSEPVNGTNWPNMSSLPFRMYQLIYNEYYRDQNLTPENFVPKTSGEDDMAFSPQLFELRRRAWEKDYFTSALPWAQRGGAVDIPLSDDPTAVQRAYAVNSPGDTFPTGTDVQVQGGNLYGNSPGSPSSGPLHVEPAGYGVNINDLRRSMRLQEWLEKNARGGARYIEQILSHFGVKSSDARLQRPEFLGGGKQPVVISEVLSTFQQDAEGIPQGNMAGHGVSVGNQAKFTRRFEEHGYVFGIMSILPKTAYQQGVPRHFTRFDKFDYYWPEFANIGEQEIKLKELYLDPDAAAGQAEETFGYTPRYAEYKYAPSTVHGEFRDTLSFWHMGRIFSAKPTLNTAFVESNPTDRIFAVSDTEQLYCQLYNRVDALRPMPYFGTPML